MVTIAVNHALHNLDQQVSHEVASYCIHLGPPVVLAIIIVLKAGRTMRAVRPLFCGVPMVAERDGEVHFARGMCEKCFRHQLNLEGVADGDDPPAYKAALMKAEQAELERVKKWRVAFIGLSAKCEPFPISSGRPASGQVLRAIKTRYC